MTRPVLNRDFVDMIRALNNAHVEYLVVGAHAMAVHGVPRATGDIDIWIRPGRENGERVIRALREFGAPVSAHGVNLEDLEKSDTVYQIGVPPRRIDLMTGVSGVSFEKAWPSRIQVKIENVSIPVIGLHELVLNKRASGRAKDLADLEILETKSES